MERALCLLSLLIPALGDQAASLRSASGACPRFAAGRTALVCILAAQRQQIEVRPAVSRKSCAFGNGSRYVHRMTDPPSWPSMSGPEWRRRVRAAEVTRDRWTFQDSTEEDEKQAQTWLGGIDPTAYVSARHHTVPRFLLARWADRSGHVRVYHRIEGRHGIENIRDLAVKDFYTFIDLDGAKNSTMESLLGYVEGRAKTYIDGILNPFQPPVPLDIDAIMSLDQFAAFQSTRTARRRREMELQAEWYAKTMAAGRIPDGELQKYTVAPHQNQSIQLANSAAQQLMPFFICRPLAVIHLGSPLLYMCDEPVVLNAPPGEFHVEDCYLTDQEIKARAQRRMRGIPKRKRRGAHIRGRIVHFSSTRPAGHGVADEILLPISPSAALLWGPLAAEPQGEPVERVILHADEATRFATMANQAMSLQALDWVVTRIADLKFETSTFPPIGPLMRVCDGTNAASLAINVAPDRFRPHRLWTP